MPASPVNCKAPKLTPFQMAEWLLFFLMECNRKQIEQILRPWGISANTYCSIIERRLHGERVSFPWESESINQDYNPMRDRYSKEVLMQAARAVEIRVKSAGTTHGIQRFEQSTATVPNAVDAVFCDDVTELFHR